MKQDSAAWKFRTQNLMATNLKKNLDHFIESIL